MTDREKIVEGLSICIENIDRSCPIGCPYYDKCTNYEARFIFQPLLRDTLELLKEQGWISVKDKLPNCNGCYLVWRPRFYIDKGMPSICYFDGQNTWHDSYGVDATRILQPEDVSHWKPLPEKP